MLVPRTSQIILAFALATGFGFLFVTDLPSTWWQLVWKGLPVWSLAVFALINARDSSGWLLAIVMAFGSLGDVLVERNMVLGALAFLIGHVVAMILYWKHRRADLSFSQRLFAWALIPLVPLLSWQLSGDPGTALYGLFLAAMAALAWTSSFPRYQVGLGAILFVVSDLLIFAQLGPLAAHGWVAYAIWLLYFTGQAMIAVGVVSALAKAQIRSS